jgi:hypothetical protein
MQNHILENKNDPRVVKKLTKTNRENYVGLLW